MKNIDKDVAVLDGELEILKYRKQRLLKELLKIEGEISFIESEELRLEIKKHRLLELQGRSCVE